MWRRGLVIAFAAGCSHPQMPPASSSPCSDAIAGFATADPNQLQPLPATCTLADANRALHSLDATLTAPLGTRNDMFTIRSFSSKRLPRISVWVDDESGRIVLIDAEWPPARATDYFTVLGPPDHSLDYPWGEGELFLEAEHLWLSKGALVVASHELTGVMRVGIFTPCSLDEYKQHRQLYDWEESCEG